MITIADRSALQLPGSPTARFEGENHSADVSVFWVRTQPGKGPDLHWHPYTETWVVVHGQVEIEADEEVLVAQAGNIVTVPADTIHRFRNIGSTELEMICIHASPTIIQEFVTPQPSSQ